MNKSSFTEMIDKCVHQILKGQSTAIPGHVLAFNPSKQLAQVQAGVEKLDVNGTSITPPPIVMVPVCFPGGQYSLEYEIAKGDEGLIIFSQRCIEAWIDQGGVSPQKYRRFHDFNDALFLPGFRSQKNKMQSFENNGIRLRDPAGAGYIWLKNDGTAEIAATMLNIIGNVTVAGNTAITGALTNNGTNVGNTHVHGGVQAGSSNTSTPT